LLKPFGIYFHYFVFFAGLPILKYIKVRSTAYDPTSWVKTSPGWELYTCDNGTVKAGETAKIPTGLKFQFPDRTFGRIIGKKVMLDKFKMEIISQNMDSDYRY